MRRLATLTLILSTAGCRGSDAGTAGVTLPVSSSWAARSTDSVLAPGRVEAAWGIPGGGNAIVFTQLPHPVTAEQLLELTRNQALSQPGCRIVDSGVRSIGGHPAMWIHLTAPGDGEILAPTPTGEPVSTYKGKPVIDTTRLWAAVIRPRDVVNVQFHYPTAREGELRAAIDDLLRSCTIRAD